MDDKTAAQAAYNHLGQQAKEALDYYIYDRIYVTAASNKNLVTTVGADAVHDEQILRALDEVRAGKPLHNVSHSVLQEIEQRITGARADLARDGLSDATKFYVDATGHAPNNSTRYTNILNSLISDDQHYKPQWGLPDAGATGAPRRR